MTGLRLQNMEPRLRQSSRYLGCLEGALLNVSWISSRHYVDKARDRGEGKLVIKKRKSNRAAAGAAQQKVPRPRHKCCMGDVFRERQLRRLEVIEGKVCRGQL